MKDSKQVRSEHQSFVDAYGQIAEASVQPEEDRKRLTKSNPEGTPREPLGGDRRPMVKVRKEGAFTEQAEKYEMSVKQFARFVEANQLLFSVETRKKAQVANAFQGFKETAEWDEFFDDFELVEEGAGLVTGTAKVINRVMKHRNQTPEQKDKAVRNLTKAMDVVAKPVKAAAKAVLSPAKGSGRGTARPTQSDPTKTYRPEGLEWDEKEINDLILEVTTKETKSGTKYKVRVKHKETGSSYIRYATREMIAQMRNDPKISSVEMTDEGDAPEEKGEKKALEKGGGDLKKSDEKQDTKQAADKGSGFAAKTKKRSVTTEAKKLDPVGKEDGDVDNDGDKDSSDEYLMKRRKAIGKAMKKEGYSDWRQDLTEVIKDTDEVGTIKEKGVKNKVEIMPKMEGYGEKTCKKCGKNPCECPKEEVTSEGMKNVMQDPSPDTQPVPSGPKATNKPSQSKPKKPLATLNRAKKGDGYFGPTVSAGGYRYGIPNPIRKEETEGKTLDEFLAGKPGDGYIGHPNLDIKNPLAKKQKKSPVLPGAQGGGLVNRVGASMGDIRMRQNQAIQNMR